MMTASRPGPKPKDGERYPGGKLKPVRQDPLGPAPALVNRMIAVVAAKASDPALEGPLGWLALRGEISHTECAAGMSYAQLRGEYDRVLGLPSRSPASPNYEAGFSRGESIGSGTKAAMRVRRRFNEAIAHLGGQLAIRDMLDRVCVYRIRPEFEDLRKLRCALGKLAGLLQLTRAVRQGK